MYTVLLSLIMWNLRYYKTKDFYYIFGRLLICIPYKYAHLASAISFLPCDCAKSPEWFWGQYHLANICPEIPFPSTLTVFSPNGRPCISS